jgi:hypothetical protein
VVEVDETRGGCDRVQTRGVERAYAVIVGVDLVAAASSGSRGSDRGCKIKAMRLIVLAKGRD